MPASEKSDRNALRVYIPATVPMLRRLVADREMFPIGGTAFAVTPTLREAYASGDDDELGEVAMVEAARASLRLLAAEREEFTGGGDIDSGDIDSGDIDGGDIDGGDIDSGDIAGEPTAAGSPVYRRAVIAADVSGAKLRPDLDDAVVKLAGPITYDQIASVHVDLAEAEPEVAKAVDVVDAADLGDTDAEFVLGDAEDHQLAWYAAQELPFLLELL